MTGVLGPRQTQWVEALESGKYPQTQRALRTTKGYCCLGVACEIAEIVPVYDEDNSTFEYDGQISSLTQGAKTFFGFLTESGDSLHGISLFRMNDTGSTFKEIASAVRADPSSYFTEPK